MINAWVADKPKVGSLPSIFFTVLVAYSLFLYVGAWWWYNRTIRSVNVQVAPTVFQRLGPQDRVALQNRLQASAIICLALMESPAVLGLVNSMMQSPYPHLFKWLAGASLAGLLLFKLTGYPAIFELLDKLELRGATSG